MTWKDRLYWFGFNFPRALTLLVSFPVWYFLFGIESLWEILKLIGTTDGSEQAVWCWQIRWPIFTEEE